jgi:hypothetical protein
MASAATSAPLQDDAFAQPISDSSHSSTHSSRGSFDSDTWVNATPVSTPREPTKKGRFQIRDLADGDSGSGSGLSVSMMPATSNIIALSAVTVENRDTGEIDHIIQDGKLLPSPLGTPLPTPRPPSLHRKGLDGLATLSSTAAAGWPSCGLDIAMPPQASSLPTGVFAPISNVTLSHTMSSSGTAASAAPLGTAAAAYAAGVSAGVTAGVSAGMTAGITAGASAVTEAGVDVQKQMGRFLVRQIGGGSGTSSAGASHNSSSANLLTGAAAPALSTAVETPSMAAAAAMNSSSGDASGSSSIAAGGGSSGSGAQLNTNSQLAMTLLQQNRMILERYVCTYTASSSSCVAV